MPTSPDRCIAVLPTYNRPKLLERCLTALRNQTHPVSSIIVVDNSSETDSAEMVRERFPEVVYLPQTRNLGGAGGWAVGIEAALRQGSDWVWVMDDDARPDPDCLEVLIRASASLPSSTSVVAPRVVSSDGSPQPLQRGSYSPVRQRQTPAPESDEPLRIGYCSFCGPLLRAEVVRRVAPPRTDFFMWYDDVEYTLRLGAVGPMYVVPEARIVHFDQTQGRRSWQIPIEHAWKLYYATRNRLLLLRSVEPSRLKRAAGYVIGVYRTVRPILATVAFRPAGARDRIAILLRGLIDGLRGRSGKRVDPSDWQRASPHANAAP